MSDLPILERIIEALAPTWAAQRAAARLKVRGFNAVSMGRRAGDDWTRVGEGKPTESAADIATLRNRAREMSRNNPYWCGGKRAIVRQVVGTGIRATAVGPNKRTRDALQTRWDKWAEGKTCDASGKLDLYGIQSLVMSTVVSDGECLVRRVIVDRVVKLQVLGGVYLSSDKDGELADGGEIVGGVETDMYGAPVAYHVYKRHPSRGGIGSGETVRLDARDVAHVFRVDRSDQVRGESWIAPVFTRLANWDDYEDAELMRQKVSACFGAVYTGVDAERSDYEPLEKLEPGMIEYLPNGADVKVIAPPASLGLRDSAVITHRAIATGLGVTYEVLTGDFSQVNFSSSRMAYLQMCANVSDWQLKVMIDLFCDRVWKWFLEGESLVQGGESPTSYGVEWTVQSRDMIDPEKETRANTARVRSGFAPWSEIVRESGRDPERVAQQIATDNARFDKLGIVLDSDPRRVSAQGQGAVNQDQEGENVDKEAP